MKRSKSENVRLKLTGLVAAPFTAMNSDCSINLPRIEKQAEHLVRNGVRGAFVCGTTGEGLSLTIDEREQIAQRWVEVASPELDVIVHVGHTSLRDAQALAAHAEAIGARAVSTLAPCFFRPSTVGDLVDFCGQVAAAAPSLPFYFYHMPSMTGVRFAMADFLAKATGRIPNLAGIKFTHEDLMDYRQCLTAEEGRFDVLFGRDEILLAGLALGAQGAVGSTYNYAAPIYHRLMQCFRDNDLAGARAQQSLAIKVIELMIRCGGMAAGKAIMSLVGINCGPVRPPLRNLTSSEFEQLQQGLTTLGFFDAVRAGAPAKGSTSVMPSSV